MKLKPPSRAACALSGVVAFLVATTIFAEQFSAPRGAEETTAKLVCDIVARYHISQHKIDDEISSKLLDRYVKLLDGQKLYFLKSDVSALEKYRHNLDDLLKAGNVDFCHQTFDTFLKRLDERIDVIHQVIDEDQNFDVDESLVIDSDELDYATDAAALRERWRKRIKYDLLQLKIDGTELPEARERLHRRYRTLQQTMQQTDSTETLELYLSALMHCFDPHSSYMSPDTLEDFRISMELSLDGIGAALRSEDGYTTVAQIVAGGAAEKDGRLKVNDRIVGVAQAGEEFVDIVEMKLSKVVRLMRGPRVTEVRLQVKSAKSNDIKVIDLTRQKIELKSSEVKGEIIDVGKRFPGETGRIGVINIPSFYRDFRGAQQGLDDFKSTARDTAVVLDTFAKEGGVDAVIIDLRGNGGGALSEAIEVSGLFIDHGPIVQVKEQDGRIKGYDDEIPGVAYDGPLVVICNRLSASASEIFAGAIKDYGRGIVVGDTSTHGKGTVQNVMPVGSQMFQFLNSQDRGALKLTINQFYRVNGDSTQNRGVRSDIVLPSLLDHMDLGESSLDNALAFDRIRPANYTTLGMVTPELIETLSKRSEARVNADGEFQKTQKDIARYVEQKNRKMVSLKESVLRAEQARQEADEKVAEEVDEATSQDGPIFPDDAYNNELLHVAVDYTQLYRGPATVQK